MFAHSEVVHSIRCVLLRMPLVIEMLFDSQAALLEHCIVRSIGRVASNFEATPTEKKIDLEPVKSSSQMCSGRNPKNESECLLTVGVQGCFQHQSSERVALNLHDCLCNRAR